MDESLQAAAAGGVMATTTTTTNNKKRQQAHSPWSQYPWGRPQMYTAPESRRPNPRSPELSAPSSSCLGVQGSCPPRCFSFCDLFAFFDFLRGCPSISKMCARAWGSGLEVRACCGPPVVAPAPHLGTNYELIVHGCCKPAQKAELPIASGEF